MVGKEVHTKNIEIEVAENVQLVSTTDLRGDITYANPAFCQVSGYTSEEMIGQHHNLVRHPDMPKAAFRDLWSREFNFEVRHSPMPPDGTLRIP
ncbi:PAS domain S-box protein [Aeromonas salmonicida]|uniref:PAS domain S-box protein n=1 Tax=Aeromonas salmonicida TaxID=645 RepID=UPI000DE5BA6A